MRLASLILAATVLAQPAAAQQSIGSLEELYGMWTLQEFQREPFQACGDVDSDSRVAIGRSVWDDGLGDIRFVDDPEVEVAVNFYEGGCTLGEALSNGGQVAVAAQCYSEGEEYSGIATFERVDAHTIRVRTPINNISVTLAACRVDHGKAGPDLAGTKLPYGSRAGMEVTVTGSSAIGTSAARIYVRHTEDDARAFCTGYLETTDASCIKEQMAEAEAFPWSVGADCTTGEFDTVAGGRYRFAGPSWSKDSHAPEFSIYPAEGGEALDGSSASGYGVALATFEALCPGQAVPAS